ncbi:MAG TPA: hypothetical protein VN765_05605 [Candidatus Acidoferrum sp.]|nr:hypothetical protein [Candidatus Acidoferrum sp.]
MFQSYTFRLIALAALIAYLCMSVGQRLRAEEARRRERERQVPGTAFDASAIASQIGRLRQDHLAAVHSHPQHARCRTAMIATVRRLVTNLAYFRHERSEHETQGHDA